MLVRALLALLALAGAADAAAQSCGSRLFLSGFFSTVHVYDACTGAYLRNLDAPTRLRGAMAVRLGPDGLLYVVAEQGGAIHKYRNDTLEYVGVFATVGAIGATGLAFDAAGVAYVASYNNGTVYRYDRSGAGLGAAFPAFPQLRGLDNGLTFGPDGTLYIPGYDTGNVGRWVPSTGAASVALAANTAGLQLTRGLLPAHDNQHLFITSEGSGRVLKWNPASGAVSVLAEGLVQPKGIDYAPDGKLLVSSGNALLRIDPDSGATLGTLVAEGAGGVSGLVFAAVIPVAAGPAPAVDATQVGTQFWVVGDGVFSGRALEFDAVSATGTAFGPTLAFSELAFKRWGRIRIELVSCTQARFSWDSTGANSAGFGSGSYDAVRYLENEDTARCRQRPLDNADRSWVNGMWWGGATRAGEGFTLDRNADGTTFFAWFTHRPPGTLAGVDRSQIGTQYWVTADARFSGRVMQMDAAYSATGTSFGPALRFADLSIKRWGSVRFELVSCTEGRFSWDSTGNGSAGFGAGSYAVFRYFDNEDTARCRQHGLDDPDKSWVSGMWWGGAPRSGEGFILDRGADGTTFFAWFTHRPR
jgi:DNA-binding beta-propeller fold protein YncE